MAKKRKIPRIVEHTGRWIMDSRGNKIPWGSKLNPFEGVGKEIFDNLVSSCEMTEEELMSYTRDIQRLMNMGFWFSDAAILVHVLKATKIQNTTSIWWDDFCLLFSGGDAEMLMESSKITERYWEGIAAFENIKGSDIKGVDDEE